MKKESSKKDAILKMQFSMAMNGSVEMLKWLGINLCGQSNQPDDADEPLPKGFDICLMPTRGQKEYEENKEEFLKWKESQDA